MIFIIKMKTLNCHQSLPKKKAFENLEQLWLQIIIPTIFKEQTQVQSKD